MSKLDKKDLFDADTSFFDLPIVWRTVGAFVGLFLAITGIILWNGSYTFDGSGSGFNFFVKEFGFPLGVLSLLIPLIAVYAAQHRSVLTIKQIKETQVQNNFSNYYKHLEEFEKYINYIFNNTKYTDLAKLNSTKTLYKRIYRDSSPLNSNFQIDEVVFISWVEATYKLIVWSLKMDFSTDDDTNRRYVSLDDIKHQNKNLLNMTLQLGFIWKEPFLDKLKQTSDPLDIIFNEIEFVIRHIMEFEADSNEKLIDSLQELTQAYADGSASEWEKGEFAMVNYNLSKFFDVNSYDL